MSFAQITCDILCATLIVIFEKINNLVLFGFEGLLVGQVANDLILAVI